MNADHSSPAVPLVADDSGADFRAHWRARLGRAALAIALIAVAALAFSAYQRPDLLLDLAGLRYCG